jgi:hypothetical protein
MPETGSEGGTAPDCCAAAQHVLQSSTDLHGGDPFKRHGENLGRNNKHIVVRSFILVGQPTLSAFWFS